jgi:hypothetical protein
MMKEGDKERTSFSYKVEMMARQKWLVVATPIVEGVLPVMTRKLSQTRDD